MTPPSLEVAREILADTAAKARANGDPFGEMAAAAIDVVLAALDQSVHGAASVITVSNPPAATAPTAILLGSDLPGVRSIQSREAAREAFGRQDGDAVWDAFGTAPPPVVVQIGRDAPHLFKSEPEPKPSTEAIAVSDESRVDLARVPVNVPLLDETGREIGVASVSSEGVRISATIVDERVARSARDSSVRPVEASIGAFSVGFVPARTWPASAEPPSIEEQARRATIREIASAVGFSDTWVQRMIDTGATVEAARTATLHR